MSVNEYNRLWLYCSHTNYMVGNAGFHAISAEDCNQMFQRLVQFERPDLYAVLDDKIVILEHFEFDASRNTRKGMKGRAEEAHLEKRLQKVPMDGTMHIDTARYEVSLQDWQETSNAPLIVTMSALMRTKSMLRVRQVIEKKPSL